jgi:hypothetical protein
VRRSESLGERLRYRLPGIRRMETPARGAAVVGDRLEP